MAIIKVKTGGITADAVTSTEIADNAVVTAAINADAVTDAKIADDVVGTEHLTANEVDTAALKADAVTGAEIADNAVNSEHYTDGSIDTAHIADAQITAAKLASGVGGITVADSWRLTADITNTDADISANLERDDTSGASYIGSAMTVSSGIFTFPATGVYQIVMYANWIVSNENISVLGMFTTVNNSSYTSRADIYASTTGGDHYKNSSSSVFFNVDNTTNCKVKFATDSMNSSCVLRGNTNKNETHFTFIRLGDST